MYCPECGTEVDADADSCPECGKNLEQGRTGASENTLAKNIQTNIKLTVYSVPFYLSLLGAALLFSFRPVDMSTNASLYIFLGILIVGVIGSGAWTYYLNH